MNVLLSARERQAAHLRFVPVSTYFSFLGRHVPQYRGLVGTARSQGFAVERKSHTGHALGMTLEARQILRLDSIFRIPGHIPHAHLAFILFRPVPNGQRTRVVIRV